VPTLICQGERDPPSGTKEEVAGYRLSSSIELFLLEDGDHDFKPRKESGATAKGNLDAAAGRAVEWMEAG
jgi:predicted alpha/beta-hydrolase family hydrolase